MTLDMSPYTDDECSDPKLYHLYGIVVHSGGMGGGHYVAYVRKGIYYYLIALVLDDVRPC